MPDPTVLHPSPGPLGARRAASGFSLRGGRGCPGSRRGSRSTAPTVPAIPTRTARRRTAARSPRVASRILRVAPEGRHCGRSFDRFRRARAGVARSGRAPTAGRPRGWSCSRSDRCSHGRLTSRRGAEATGDPCGATRVGRRRRGVVLRSERTNGRAQRLVGAFERAPTRYALHAMEAQRTTVESVLAHESRDRVPLSPRAHAWAQDESGGLRDFEIRRGSIPKGDTELVRMSRGQDRSRGNHQALFDVVGGSGGGPLGPMAVGWVCTSYVVWKIELNSSFSASPRTTRFRGNGTRGDGNATRSRRRGGTGVGGKAMRRRRRDGMARVDAVDVWAERFRGSGRADRHRFGGGGRTRWVRARVP